MNTEQAQAVFAIASHSGRLLGIFEFMGEFCERLGRAAETFDLGDVLVPGGSCTLPADKLAEQLAATLEQFAEIAGPVLDAAMRLDRALPKPN